MQGLVAMMYREGKILATNVTFIFISRLLT